MEIKTICDKYLATKGLRRVKGSDQDASTLLPHILMYEAKNLFDDYVNSIESEFKMQECKGKWLKAFNNFRNELFVYLNTEEKDFVTIMMADFEEYIQEYLKVAFWQVTNVCSEEPFEKQKVLAACVIISVLTQSACIVWRQVFTPLSHADRKYSNKNLEACIKYIQEWQILYRGKDKPYIDCNENENINLAINTLCQEQIKYLKIYHK